MKVSELIELLKDTNQNAEILFDEGGCYYDIDDASADGDEYIILSGRKVYGSYWMKKIVTIVLFVLISGCAHANGYYNGNYYYHDNNEWGVPFISGLSMGSISIGSMSRPPQPVYMPPTVIYPPTYPKVPYGYHYESIYDVNLGGYRTVIVPN